MTEQEINEMMAEAAAQARRNTEAGREAFSAELERASKLTPRQLLREFGESI